VAASATRISLPQVSTCSNLQLLPGAASLQAWHITAMNATLAVRPNAGAVELARNETQRRVAGATALDVGVALALNGTNDTSVLPTIFTGIVHAVVRPARAPALPAVTRARLPGVSAEGARS
jgi:hypothetical protein